MSTRLVPITVVALVTLTVVALPVYGDWTETNLDGSPSGGLDYLAYWVASWNGNSPIPATTWDTASNLSGVYGTDPGWTGWVVNIADADATAYAAANQFESFTDVEAKVSVSTADTDEEFGAIIRASDFDHGDPITNVSAYAATFTLNNATGPGDDMKFTLYKFVDGTIEHSIVRYPDVPTDFDDLIVAIELTAVGNTITAKLFEDADSATALETITWEDTTGTPLISGYTGVLNLDYTSADGISSFYDTLSSIVVPEPAALQLLLGGLALIRRRRRQRTV